MKVLVKLKSTYPWTMKTGANSGNFFAQKIYLKVSISPLFTLKIYFDIVIFTICIRETVTIQDLL